MTDNGDYSGLDLSRPNPGAGNRNGALVFYGSGAGREGVLRPYPTDFTNFGPHLGFAFRLTSKTVIRGGYSIVYQALGNGGCGCRTGFANPIVVNSDGVNPALNWDNGIAPPPRLPPAADDRSDSGQQHGCRLLFKELRQGPAYSELDFQYSA